MITATWIIVGIIAYLVDGWTGVVAVVLALLAVFLVGLWNLS